MNINEAMYLAVQSLRAGDLEQAERIFKEILKIQPDNADALQLLGVIFYQNGSYNAAMEYMEKALLYAPANADVHNNLGIILQSKGQFDESIACYQKALQLRPGFFQAQFNLGNAFRDKGLMEEAVSSYQKTIELKPDLAEAYFNLGAALQSKGQLDTAVTFYRKAIELKPDYVEAYNNLGVIFQSKGQLDESLTLYRKALEINPNFIQAYNNSGNALRDQDRMDEAIASYEQSLAINSNQAETYYNMANALGYQGKLDKALSAYDKALEHKPDFIMARWARCMSQLMFIYPDQSSIQISRDRYRDELIQLRDRISLETSQDIEAAARAVGSYQPFLLAYQNLNDRELQGLYGELVCKIMKLRYPKFAERPHMPQCCPKEPLRIGVVSGYFYKHSNWKLRKGWITNLDKYRFKTYGYYTGKNKDRLTEVARRHFHRFIEDIQSFEELCEIIRNDKLHVLIFPEIGMDPITVRLASLRLASVQCISWGHPDTSGFPTIDYFLSSDLMEPPDADDHYTEKLIRLPNLSVYYTPLDVPVVDVNRSIFGLRDNSVLYLCCQSLFKYLPQYDEIYPRIAQKADNCQFAFISERNDYVTEQFRTRLSGAFRRFGMAAEDYVVFLPRLDPRRYHAINCLADIYLDTIGWSGCNSTLEAIACNLPVVTLPGGFMRGRHSAAILSMMGMTETIASSIDEYVDIAGKLWSDEGWRRHLSATMANKKHLIYRDRTCITALENFLERAVRENGRL